MPGSIPAQILRSPQYCRGSCDERSIPVEGTGRASEEKLETMSGKTVVMELKTDPSVLAGVRVELDGKLFDGTVKGRLAELSRRISDTVV